MKLFELQTNLTSFVYPVVKIIICLLVIMLSIARNRFFHCSREWVNAVVTILCFVLTMISIPCLYISIGELCHVASNRRNTNCNPADAERMTIEEVVGIVSENDIVEIEVCTGNKAIIIGASSECKYASSVFEDKLFYISSSEYDRIDLFAEALIDLFPNGIIPVLKIDGLPLE